MPRNPDEVQICSPQKVACIDEAVTTVEESAYDDAHLTRCHCLPACSDMEYPHETSYGKIGRADAVSLPKSLKGHHIGSCDTSISVNLAQKKFSISNGAMAC